MTISNDTAEELPGDHDVQFIDPSPRMAAYQRNRTIQYMAGVLGRDCPNLHDSAAVIDTLARANIDPHSIAYLWQTAMTAAQTKKAGPRLH